MASIIVPNTTRDLIIGGELNIIIVSSNNNSKFKEGLPIYLRASNGPNTQEKIFNTIAESGYVDSDDMNVDENGDYYAIIEKCSTFQVMTYNLEEAKYDIFINGVYLTAKEQQAFLAEQNLEQEEFLARYGKTNNYHGYLIKFKL